MALLDPSAYIGRAAQQVEEFLATLEKIELPEEIEAEPLRV
jgi:hypothetical protein